MWILKHGIHREKGKVKNCFIKNEKLQVNFEMYGLDNLVDTWSDREFSNSAPPTPINTNPYKSSSIPLITLSVNVKSVTRKTYKSSTKSSPNTEY